MTIYKIPYFEIGGKIIDTRFFYFNSDGKLIKIVGGVERGKNIILKIFKLIKIKIIFVLFLFISTTRILAQEKIYDNKKKIITYEKLQIMSKGIFETIQCDIYVAKDGSQYTIGDTLIIGQPSLGKIFAFISQANKNTSISPPRSVFGFEPELLPLPKSEIVPQYVSPLIVSNMITIIQRIDVNGTKRRGFRIKIVGKAHCISCPPYLIDFEDAFSAGEIKSFRMSNKNYQLP